SVTSMPDVLYDSNTEEFVTAAHPQLSALYGMGIKNPTVGLYSSTNGQKGATLNQAMLDGLNAIVFGRADVSTFDQLVKDWRSNGGDQIRAEYARAYDGART